MSFIVSDDIANAQLDLIESIAGTSPLLKFWSGAVVDITTDPGTLLASMTLPSDWMTAASARSKALLGSWITNAAIAAGTMASFGLYTSAGVPKGRGKVGVTGDGTAQITFPVLTTTVGIALQMTTFTLTR